MGGGLTSCLSSVQVFDGNSDQTDMNDRTPVIFTSALGSKRADDCRIPQNLLESFKYDRKDQLPSIYTRMVSDMTFDRMEKSPEGYEHTQTNFSPIIKLPSDKTDLCSYYVSPDKEKSHTSKDRLSSAAATEILSPDDSSKMTNRIEKNVSLKISTPLRSSKAKILAMEEKEYEIFPQNYDEIHEEIHGYIGGSFDSVQGVGGYIHAQQSRYNSYTNRSQPLSRISSRKNSQRYSRRSSGVASMSSSLRSSNESSRRASTGNIYSISDNELIHFDKQIHEVIDEQEEVYLNGSMSINNHELATALKNLERIHAEYTKGCQNTHDDEKKRIIDCRNGIPNDLHGNMYHDDGYTLTECIDRSIYDEKSTSRMKNQDEDLHRAIKMISRDNSIRYHPSAMNHSNNNPKKHSKEPLTMAQYKEILQSSQSSSSCCSSCPSRAHSIDMSQSLPTMTKTDNLMNLIPTKSEAFLCVDCNIPFEDEDDFIDHVQFSKIHHITIMHLQSRAASEKLQKK